MKHDSSLLLSIFFLRDDLLLRRLLGREVDKERSNFVSITCEDRITMIRYSKRQDTESNPQMEIKCSHKTQSRPSFLLSFLRRPIAAQVAVLPALSLCFFLFSSACLFISLANAATS